MYLQGWWETDTLKGDVMEKQDDQGSIEGI